ncbi:hypothetical protein LR48_Vigan04g052100 [Vigna angularis]|uniref:Aminotransferase class V domain-containing protein n=1 Tax=Phaseolus angularis TaxID=3914 RepID=A0A0L9UC26_PHAAN|nr:hypothetical protein LR48_Vigan04g052100 [Vigna angularis]
MSVMEMSHRGKEFLSIIQKAESDLCTLLQIMSEYSASSSKAAPQPNSQSYLHICANETIHGVEYKEYPVPQSGVLVADMSSNFCSKPVDVSKFGVIYAGIQKNVGPSSVTIVIIRKDLIGKGLTPMMLDFKIHGDNNSLYNTPPSYGIYMYGLVFEHLLEKGGTDEQKFLEASMAYVSGNPIMTDKEFDELKLRLKVKRSKSVSSR